VRSTSSISARTNHIAAAERWQPAQRDREQIDQEDADQEGRQRNADQRYRLKYLRQPRVALERRIDPHQDAEHHRQNRRTGGEFQGGRHPLLQQIRDRLAKLIGDAELEPDGITQIARELHDDGIVKTERFANLGALGGRGIERNDLVDRIAGEAKHRERDDADRDHDANGLNRPAKSESEHGFLSLFLDAAASLSPGNEKSRKREAAGTIETCLFLFGCPVQQHLIVGPLR
jgi:hypothetical protein